MSLPTSVLLPTPPLPVMATTGVAGGFGPTAARIAGNCSPRATSVSSAGQRQPIALREAREQVVKHASGSPARAETRRSRRSGVPGPNTRATPSSSSFGTSASGMMPPTSTPTCSKPGCAQHLQDARHQRHVRAAQQADAQPVGVLVGHGAHDRFGRLPQPGVDDVKARVAQGPRHDLDAAIVAVEADLGEHDSQRELSVPCDAFERAASHAACDSRCGSCAQAYTTAASQRPNTSARAFMISPTRGTGPGGLEQRGHDVLAAPRPRGARRPACGATSSALRSCFDAAQRLRSAPSRPRHRSSGSRAASRRPPRRH